MPSDLNRPPSPPRPLTTTEIIRRQETEKRRQQRPVAGSSGGGRTTPSTSGLWSGFAESDPGASIYNATLVLPTSGTWVVTGTTSVQWSSTPGGSYLIQTGITHDAGGETIQEIEQAGGWQQAIAPWSFLLYPDGRTGRAVVGSNYDLDSIGVPDSVYVIATAVQIR